MNNTRFAAKAFAGTLAATVLVLGSLAGPAQAKKDTGWGVSGSDSHTTSSMRKDTGWGVSNEKRDTGWGVSNEKKDTGWG